MFGRRITLSCTSQPKIGNHFYSTYRSSFGTYSRDKIPWRKIWKLKNRLYPQLPLQHELEHTWRKVGAFRKHSKTIPCQEKFDNRAWEKAESNYAEIKTLWFHLILTFNVRVIVYVHLRLPLGSNTFTCWEEWRFEQWVPVFSLAVVNFNPPLG
jgi:hypothetical protein